MGQWGLRVNYKVLIDAKQGKKGITMHLPEAAILTVTSKGWHEGATSWEALKCGPSRPLLIYLAFTSFQR